MAISDDVWDKIYSSLVTIFNGLTDDELTEITMTPYWDAREGNA